MGTVTVTVESLDALKRRMKAAFAGKRQGERISFESVEVLWKVLAPNRLTLVQTLAAAGPVTLREAARRVGRDVRAVHADVHLLLNAGVLDKCEDGRIAFPYSAMHFDFMCGARRPTGSGPKLKEGTKVPTPEEDAEIAAGIAADPDTYELSDEEFSQLRPIGHPEAAPQARTLTITAQPEWRAELRSAGQRAQARTYQGKVLNFESPAAFFGRLTERRWELARALQGQGEMAVRELARRVARDVKRVHEDVQVLAELGLVERTESGAVVCPFAEVHIDMRLTARTPPAQRSS